MRRTLPLLFALGCLAGSAAAEGQDVERGQRVRVTITAGERLTGRVAEIASDALLLDLDDDRGSRSIPTVELENVETRGSRSRARGAWSKAKWGALIGAIPGAISLGIQHDQVGEEGTSVAGAAALGVWSGGIFGGLIGAAVGALSPGEEWVSVSTAVHTGADAGFSIAVSVEF